MKFVLCPLVEQVYQSVTPDQLLGPKETSEKARQLCLELAGQLQVDVMAQLFKACKKKAETAYLHATQACAVNLADKLHAYMNQVSQLPLPKSAQRDCISFYKVIENHLLQLLSLLQTSFPEYSNPEQKIPEHDRLQIQPYFEEAAGLLEKRAREGVDARIIFLVTEPLRKPYPISYGMYAYRSALLARLQSVDARAFTETLILYNFNHGDFVNYLLDGWGVAISQLETKEARAEQWAIHLRTIQRMHPLSVAGLYKHAPSCKQLLVDAIQSEITLCEKQQPLPEAAPGAKAIETSLSVAQLAGMVRLMVDAGILTCTSQAALLKNIAANFTARQQKAISPDSLRQKYYHQDPASVSILKTHLSNMLGQLRNH
jgi:hypothetical protein